jgi:hypothetical protein
MATKAKTEAKVTDAQLKAVGAYMQSQAIISLKGNNQTTCALLVAHGTQPSTHADAQGLAKRWLTLMGYNTDTAFSYVSCWHSVRNLKGKPHRFSATSAKARYDANARISHGGAFMYCQTHKYERALCEGTCKQGLRIEALAKWVYEVASPKAKARVSKPKGKPAKVTVTNNEMPNIEANNEMPNNEIANNVA